jgi:hypothetical protein
MRTDIVVLGIIVILAINLGIFFLVKNRNTDKGLKRYLKNSQKS